MRNGKSTPKMPDPTELLKQAEAEARRRTVANRTITQIALQTIRPGDKKKGLLLAERCDQLREVFGDFALDANLFIPVANSLIEASKGLDGKPVFSDLLDLALTAETFSDTDNLGGLPDTGGPHREGDDDGEDLQERASLSR